MATPRSFVLRIGAVVVLVTGGSCNAPPRQQMPSLLTPLGGAHVTHGLAAGDVTSTSAVLWARCDRAAQLQVSVHQREGDWQHSASMPVNAERDFTAKLHISELEAQRVYDYRVSCSDAAASAPDAAPAATGTFKTAPRANDPQAVSFVWGGDVGGQNVCRDSARGYAVFDTVAQQRADFFIGLGDMIYADDPCHPTGRYGNAQIPGPPRPAADLAEFWEYWKYNRADPACQRLLATVPYYPVWDDHEVFNDFDPHHDTGPSPPYPAGRHLLPVGLRAFLDYNPIAENPAAPHRLYRSVRWGKHLEVFFLDTRQYRDANSQEDDPHRPKTMLGRLQRQWLEDGLRRSDATWKVIVSSVPLSVPTGTSQTDRDGWANFDQSSGFENELLDILRFLRNHHIGNHLWISTDIHFAAVFRYMPFPEDPAFRFYEVDTGPLNAGVLPQDKFDTTLGTERLFFYPEQANPAEGFERAMSWFNFGVVRIDASGQLAISIVNANGDELYELSLPPD